MAYYLLSYLYVYIAATDRCKYIIKRNRIYLNRVVP